MTRRLDRYTENVYLIIKFVDIVPWFRMKKKSYKFYEV